MLRHFVRKRETSRFYFLSYLFHIFELCIDNIYIIVLQNKKNYFSVTLRRCLEALFQLKRTTYMRSNC